MTNFGKINLNNLKNLSVNKILPISEIEVDKRYKNEIYCHNCGYLGIILESPAEGYYCPKCGSSDSDE